MIVYLAKNQCNLLIDSIRTRMENSASVLNNMDNGDIEYDIELYDKYYSEYKELKKAEEYLSIEINNWSF